MKQRIISALLALCMALSLLPFAAMADQPDQTVVVSGTWGKHAQFALTADGVLTITGTGPILADEWRVTYPEGARSIPVFDTLVVSEGITRIGNSAFATWGVKKAILYGEIGGEAFWECQKLETVYVMNAKELSNSFAGCPSLKNVYLADSIQHIYGGAFGGCRSLEEIRIPQGVLTLHDGVFSGCTSLKKITMPAVQFVGSGCFQDCKKLKDVYYAGTEEQLRNMRYEPGGNVTFEEARFHLIPAMPDPFYGYFDMPAPGNWAYEGISFCLENGYMNGMGGGYFRPGSITTRAQLVTILWRVCGEPKAKKAAPFDDCDIDWAKDAIDWAAENRIVNGVGKNKFKPNDSITREQVVTIFYRYCREYLKTQMAPGKSLSVFPDASAVSGWAKDAMEWGTAVKLISGVGTARGPELQPQAYASRAQIARIIMNFCRAGEPEDTLQWYLDRDGTLYITGTGAIPDYTAPTGHPLPQEVPQTPWAAYHFEIRAVVIGEGITRVGSNVFRWADNLQSVSLPSTLREIGDHAFSCLPLRVLELPNGLVRIGNGAFSDTAILKLDIPETVTELGENAFGGCGSLQLVRVPDSVTELPKDVFCNCPGLRNVSLPAGLKSLDQDPFRGSCNIENIYFGGSQAQWDALTDGAPAIFVNHVYCRATLDADGNPHPAAP